MREKGRYYGDFEIIVRFTIHDTFFSKYSLQHKFYETNVNYNCLTEISKSFDFLPYIIFSQIVHYNITITLHKVTILDSPSSDCTACSWCLSRNLLSFIIARYSRHIPVLLVITVPLKLRIHSTAWITVYISWLIYFFTYRISCLLLVFKN